MTKWSSTMPYPPVNIPILWIPDSELKQLNHLPANISLENMWNHFSIHLLSFTLWSSPPMNTFRLQLAGSALWRSSSALSEKHISRILNHQKDEGTITILSSSVVNDPSRSLVGGFNPSEKYESQLGWLLPTYGKIKNVPNHQPVV